VFDPKKFEVSYGTALKQLVQEKLKGHKFVTREMRPAGGDVVDLMEALKCSLKGGAENA
jgi:DNA end-binding protein Ku